MTPAETALATLREHCTPAQRETLDKEQRFEAVGPSGKRYGLRLDKAGVSVSWQSALHGPWSAWVKGRLGTLPVGDLALLAKLNIENAEEVWLVAGNRCGSVWVEDRGSHAPQAVAYQQALQQNVFLHAAQQQQALVQQNPLLPVGALYTDVFGNRYLWNGEAWVAIA